MKHKIGYNRLGRKTAHRVAMTRNMLTSFFRYERIKTTKAKALAVRRKAEKMITRSRLDSVHNRRMIGRDIKDKAVLAKLFTDIGPRYVERPGGYTRILKLGPRPSDAAEMVILELVKDDEPGKPSKKSTRKKAEPAKQPARAKAKKPSATAPPAEPENVEPDDTPTAVTTDEAATPETGTGEASEPADEPAKE